MPCLCGSSSTKPTGIRPVCGLARSSRRISAPASPAPAISTRCSNWRSRGGLGRAPAALRPQPQRKARGGDDDQGQQDGDQRDRARDAGVEESGKSAWIPKKSAPCASPPMSAARPATAARRCWRSARSGCRAQRGEDRDLDQRGGQRVDQPCGQCVLISARPAQRKLTAARAKA